MNIYTSEQMIYFNRYELIKQISVQLEYGNSYFVLQTNIFTNTQCTSSNQFSKSLRNN